MNKKELKKLFVLFSITFAIIIIYFSEYKKTRFFLFLKVLSMVCLFISNLLIINKDKKKK